MRTEVKQLIVEKINKYGLFRTSELFAMDIETIVEELELPFKTFKDIEFEEFEKYNGVISRTEFENGYGVSVIKHDNSYGGDRGLYELAIIKDGDIVYDTPITSDVIGHLTPEEVSRYMIKIQELK